MSSRSIRLVGALAIVSLVVLAAVLGSTSRAGTAKAGKTSAVSGTINFDGIWTGAEASAFGAVIKEFNKTYPKVKVNYKPVGDNLPTVVSTAVAGGNPPDMADIAQPGFVKQLIAKGALKPIGYATSTLKRNFSPSWIKLGTFTGKIYGLVFKASNKSTVWYNVHAFKTAGVKPPTTWPQFTKAASTIKASGVPPYSIGGAVIAELISANRGLGYLIQLSAMNFDTTGVFVALVATTCIVFLGNWSVNAVEHRLLRWRPRSDLDMQAGS